MIRTTFQGESLPLLGFGAMRLPVINGINADIDIPHTKEMIAYSMAHGLNYFDTAWGYHDGNSETVIGELLSAYDRDSFYLASKFPGYDVSNMNKVEEIFEKQLKKCQVDYFDFYLFHNVCELNIDEYLNPAHGIFEYLIKQKESGRIKHLGFSAHGSYEVIERFLEAYGKQMEFCQLQINWVDWEFQGAREKAELLAKHHIPLWVMEPLRGGSLASLPEESEAELKHLRPDESVVEWSFRFLQSLPNISIILGGMSNLEQLKQNIATFKDEKPLQENERDALQVIADRMINEVGLACTGCKYCTSHCPQQLDIPQLIELYNQRVLTGDQDFIASMVLGTLPPEKQPSECVACGSCEEVCPQQLKIADAMADFAHLMK